MTKEHRRQRTDAERFDAKIDRQANGCWIWTGGLLSGGYGQFSVAGKSISAHRWSYEFANGPIPKGAKIGHVIECSNRACVNPKHLQIITLTSGGRRLTSQCVNGHEINEKNTYYSPHGERSCRVCRTQRAKAYLDQARLKRNLVV